MVRVRGLGGPAAGSLRGAARGRSRPGARARVAVPRGRGGARRDRRAAHVQPRRRGGEDRRLHHLGYRRNRLCRREASGSDRGGGPHRRRAPRWSTCRPVRSADGRSFCGRSGRWPRIKASAPRPQRRTAPFRRKGRVRRRPRNEHVLRNRENRRKAIPRRAGTVPARRAAARCRRANVVARAAAVRGRLGCRRRRPACRG